MPTNNVKKIYMTNNMQDLNSRIGEIPNAPVKSLLRSAVKIMDEAELADKVLDEELAYLYFMRYFEIVRKMQGLDDYKNNKKYYDKNLGTKKFQKVIQRAEELAQSLEYRYELLNEKSSSSFDRTTSNSSKISSVTSSVTNSVDSFSKSTSSSVSDSSFNGTAKRESFINCKKLFSLMAMKSESFLVVDLRPKKDFDSSSMKISTLINMPEETVHPGSTAEKLGRGLDERSRALWARRHTYDHLILCDWGTQESPFPPLIEVVISAIIKWDPGKVYKSSPVVLDGGFDLFRIMYPMYVNNPQPDSAPESFSVQFGSSTAINTSLLNFDYPNLDNAFISTPSPDHSASIEYPSLNLNDTPKIDKLTSDESPSMEYPSLSFNEHPKFDRGTKPNSTTSTYFSLGTESIDSKSSGTNPFNNAFNGTENSVSQKYHSLKKDMTTIPAISRNFNDLQGPKNIPSVPSRSLKPKDLLDSINAKQQQVEEQKEMLEQSFVAEKEALKKLEEIEETQKQKEVAEDERTVAKLSEKETRLNEDASYLSHRSKDLEDKCASLEKQNEEYRKFFEAMSSEFSKNLKLNDQVEPDHQVQLQSNNLKEEEEKKKALQLEVEKLRKERREKENQMREQFARKEAEKRKEENATKILFNDNRTSNSKDQINWAERSSRADRPSTKGKGDTYTTRLKSSPTVSPMRGGTNLKRSHSALNISQLNDNDNNESGKIMPVFNRNLKPLESPRRRNINAARNRTFEPKYGSVGSAKTGLKNLGNTCYMNSIIQCLNNTGPLAKYFNGGHYCEDINPNSLQNGDIAEEVGAVIRALWCGQYKSIAMWDLKTVVGRHHRPFHGTDQQDAHEFLIYLMEWLQHDLNLVQNKYPKMDEQNFDSGLPDYVAAQQVMEELDKREESVMRTLFHGLHRSQIICQSCHHRSLTFEPFSILTLSITMNGRCSLKDLLQDSYKETKIEYKCSRCKRMQNCIRKLDIWKLPSILVIHLNRFEHDVLTKKKQNYIDFPLDNLDLSHYTVQKNRKSSFNLYGVSNHYGTMDGGHYTAYCRFPDSRNWSKFDDHEVYDLPRESVRSSAAYILFYEVVNDNFGSFRSEL